VQWASAYWRKVNWRRRDDKRFILVALRVLGICQGLTQPAGRDDSIPPSRESAARLGVRGRAADDGKPLKRLMSHVSLDTTGLKPVCMRGVALTEAALLTPGV
jgi:hypothetical protein